jgi:hypothetical protein
MTSPMTSQSNGDIGLVTCGRNEGPYILEWVAWHRFIGFNRIRYYDNESNDSSREILGALSSLGIIEPFFQPDMQGISPQIDSYNKALRDMKACEWIGFWDVDEFLIPSVYPFGLKDWLSSFAEDISAIAINWRIIGSSGKIFAEESPVMKRFTKGSLISNTKNDHIKTIVRSKKTSFMGVHMPPLEDVVGSMSNACGTLVEPYTSGLVHPPCWSPVVLHHYIVKSREELLRKLARGRGDFPREDSNNLRDIESYAKDHDLNDEDITINDDLLKQFFDYLDDFKYQISLATMAKF